MKHPISSDFAHTRSYNQESWDPPASAPTTSLPLWLQSTQEIKLPLDAPGNAGTSTYTRSRVGPHLGGGFHMKPSGTNQRSEHMGLHATGTSLTHSSKIRN